MLGPFLPDWQPLSLPQQVAQLIVVRTTGHLFDSQIRYPQWEADSVTLQHWIQELGIGGVILLGGSVAELALRTQQLQDWSQVPLLMAADIEEGVGRRFEGATWMPPPLALGTMAQRDLSQACAYAKQLGSVTAQEAKAVGLNWILGPVVDINNNPQNPAINVRAFGETPEIVTPLIEAFIQGTQGWGVLTAAKHFPGHGDTAIDPHLDLPLISHPRERLEQIELVPFQAAIAAKVSAIMTAHLQVPALDPDYPTSLSPLTLTQLLRQEMGFDGLIVTDALVMQAITKHYGAYEAPVMALEAGSDIILMPVDPPGTIAAICEAVQTGRISRERIHASLERIWRAKQVACAPMLSGGTGHEWETQGPLTFQPDAIAQSQAIELCQAILEQSLVVQFASASDSQAESMIGEGQLGAIAPTNLILIDNLLDANFLGMHTPAIKLPQQWGYQLQWIDNQMPKFSGSGLGPALGSVDAQNTLLQLFIRSNPFQDTTGLVQMAQHLIETLIGINQLQGLALYGSPYVWAQLAPLILAHVPAVFTYGQMPTAQTIALENLAHLGLITRSSQAIQQGFTD
ncbi:MAG: beta-glucosidase [Cyanothece sp. SIO2G6]|nr:beta-glucosidase [Cyanothece sp. SIO2G6]